MPHTYICDSVPNDLTYSLASADTSPPPHMAPTHLVIQMPKDLTYSRASADISPPPHTAPSFGYTNAGACAYTQENKTKPRRTSHCFHYEFHEHKEKMKFPVLKISSSFCLMFAVCSRGCEYVCKVRGAPWSHSQNTIDFLCNKISQWSSARQ